MQLDLSPCMHHNDAQYYNKQIILYILLLLCVGNYYIYREYSFSCNSVVRQAYTTFNLICIKFLGNKSLSIQQKVFPFIYQNNEIP